MQLCILDPRAFLESDDVIYWGARARQIGCKNPESRIPAGWWNRPAAVTGQPEVRCRDGVSSNDHQGLSLQSAAHPNHLSCRAPPYNPSSRAGAGTRIGTETSVAITSRRHAHQERHRQETLQVQELWQRPGGRLHAIRKDQRFCCLFFNRSRAETPRQTSLRVRGTAQGQQGRELAEEEEPHAVVAAGRGRAFPGRYHQPHGLSTPGRVGLFRAVQPWRPRVRACVLFQVSALSIQEIVEAVNSHCREVQTRGCQAARWDGTTGADQACLGSMVSCSTVG